MAHEYGQFDSWKIVNEENAEKSCDKSFFTRNGSGIPAEIRWFFDAEDMQLGQNKNIVLHYNERIYDIRINRESNQLGRTRMFWPVEFSRDFAAKKKKPADALTARFIKRYDGLYVEPYLTETKLFDINQIVELLNSLSINNHLIQSNMVQLGRLKEEASTIHIKKDMGYILYVTQGDFETVQAAGGLKDIIVKLDANKVDRQTAEKQMEGQARQNPELIFCITDGNKVYNNPPKYQPHCIYLYSNDAIKAVISVLSGREVPVMASNIDIDYIGVLDYLTNNQEIPYSNPDAPGISQAEKERLLSIKEKGQYVVGEMKKMAEACKAKYNLGKCLQIQWLDGSNTKTRKYLWAQMKYSNYADDPISISIFVEKNGDQGSRYRLSLEIKNDGTDKKTMERYHSFLDVPIDKQSGLVFVSGSNEWGNPEIIKADQYEIRDRIKNGELRKVQLCKYIERPDNETNEYYHEELLKAVDQLIPYYEYVLGVKSEYWPSKKEYDPGLSVEDWIKIINDPNTIEKRHLMMLTMMMELGGESTCVKLAQTYGKSYAYYNSTGQDIGRRVHKNYGVPLCPDGNAERLFPIPFVGRRVSEEDKGRYSWKVREELYEALQRIDLPHVEKAKEETMVNYPLNLILYGPPGTGKTYNSVNYAVAICDGASVDSLTNYEEALERFNELKKEGRIAFTTFHQSYGYEEFIEGIKPIMASETNLTNDIQYDIVPGMFKEFCEKARQVTISTEKSAVEKKNPKVWSLMLDGTGESKLKTYCYEHDEIRIGWPKLPDRITYETEIDTETTRTMLINFQDEMEAGDIVVIPKIFDRIEAVGIITGDYEYDNVTFGGEWPRKRTVKWIAKDIDENLYELNDEFHLGRLTVYPLNRIKADDIITLANKNNGAEVVYVEQEAKPYVFIIDEINRGNISKIFGELITLIEVTKRAGAREAMETTLPYSGDLFSVPKNVYILGTMNTADRSIALMDTALRRRFDFEEKMPDPKVLEGITVSKDGVSVNIAELLRTINKRIEYLYDREHTIGHAFFIKLRENNTLEALADIFKNNVVPLLQEYFYEDYEKIQMVLGDNGKSSKEYQFIKDESFDARDVFVGNINYDNLDIVEKKYSVQKSAFDKIQSYKEIGKDI